MTETSEQRTRRRWINLAELVAVAGLLIAAAGLYFSWADRRETAADKAASAKAAAADRGRVTLSASIENDGQRLRLREARRELSDVTIAFPQALGVSTQNPSEPVIDASPFTDALLRLTDGGPDERSGRLPVLVTSSYADDAGDGSATGLYDVLWRTHGRLGRGRALELTGLRLRRRGGDRAALETAWKQAGL